MTPFSQFIRSSLAVFLFAARAKFDRIPFAIRGIGRALSPRRKKALAEGI
jgi:hypothetical protein